MSRTPSSSAIPARLRSGAWAWVLSGMILPVQLLVALQWPEGYSLADNAISDLGVTTCGPFADGGQVRAVCSPWHAVFNGGLIASGVLIAIGALLLRGLWQRRTGRAGMAIMALTGVLLIVVGLAPWDLQPDLHDAVAFAQALAQWIAMILLAVAAGPGIFRWLTLAVTLFSVLMTVEFLAVLEGGALLGSSLGISERLAFDSLAIWVMLAGLAQGFGRPRGALTGHRGRASSAAS